MNLSSLIYELLFRLWNELMYLIEDELHRFLHPLEDWMTDLVNRPLPPDWRQRLHAYLDEQHAEGFEVAPEHRPHPRKPHRILGSVSRNAAAR